MAAISAMRGQGSCLASQVRCDDARLSRVRCDDDSVDRGQGHPRFVATMRGGSGRCDDDPQPEVGRSLVIRDVRDTPGEGRLLGTLVGGETHWRCAAVRRGDFYPHISAQEREARTLLTRARLSAAPEMVCAVRSMTKNRPRNYLYDHIILASLFFL